MRAAYEEWWLLVSEQFDRDISFALPQQPVGFCIENGEFCIENDEFCIQNDEFCITRWRANRCC